MKQLRIGRPPKDSLNWQMTTKEKYNSYQENEDEIIKANWTKLSDEKIGLLINRSAISVTNRRIRLRLLRERLCFKMILKYAYREAEIMRATFYAVQDMKAILIMISIEQECFKRDKLKAELLKLDKLNLYKRTKTKWKTLKTVQGLKYISESIM